VFYYFGGKLNILKITYFCIFN